ncbi:MAG: GAF domain-containing protein [Endomicrobiales bacterium]|nr:GAF domain-containing protein [Endomicrobiales bacterium]
MPDLGAQKLQSILKANRIISSTLVLSELLRQIMELAREVVEAETASILLYDEKTDELYFNLALSDRESDLKQVRLKSGEGIAGCVAREKKSVIVNDASSDPRWAKKADDSISFKTRSILAVPLIFKDQFLGVVEAINKKGGGFTEEDASVLESFAAQSSVSIVNARIFEKLEEEKNKIEAVFSQMSDGAIFVDDNGRKILANDSAKKLLGKERTELSDTADIFSGFAAKPELNEALSSEEKNVTFEMFRKEPKSMYLGGVVTKIRDASGRLIGSIFIFNDITSEKKETTIKRNFISLISHKLKTPLVTITGYCPLLLDDPSLGEFPKKAITSIGKQGGYLASLVDKLLFFTMVDSETLELETTKTSFSKITEAALFNLKHYTEQVSAKVTVNERIKTLPEIEADEKKVEAVVRNVVENAVKFNKSGQKTVTIDALEDDGRIGITVKDNGPGIPPEERGKVFQKFYQIEESFTGQVEGAGLGLALAKQIMEAHGGGISIESVVNSGSTFAVFIRRGRGEQS